MYTKQNLERQIDSKMMKEDKETSKIMVKTRVKNYQCNLPLRNDQREQQKYHKLNICTYRGEKL